ncbi:MAG: hypothetical protein HY296_00465 [Thaumarchaeota archaeon]|nr:hypothetical protein [Nitrososphaerota archaeon]
MKRVKRHEFPYVYAKGKRLFHIVATLEDVPGALGSVLELLRKRVNLIGSVSYSLKGGEAIWSSFGESLSPVETEESLSRLIQSSNLTKEFEVHQSKDGLLVDGFHSGIQTETGESLVMLPREGLSHMFDQVVAEFGSGGELLLYNQGTLLGRDGAEVFIRMLGAEVAKSKVADLRPVFSASGWGIPTRLAENPPGTYTLMVEDCFECSSGHEVARTCSFLRGYFEGSGTAILGILIACEETKCRLRGDPHCEFVIGPKK